MGRKSAMTSEDWEKIKPSLKRLHEEIQELWMEKQLLRNLIIDSGWMPERDLDTNLEKAKTHPENIRQTKEHWRQSEQTLAELGLDEWLAEFEKRFPRDE
jgi:hypothetical protein